MERMNLAKSDDELVRAILAGDRQAASQWYERHLPAIWRYVRLNVDQQQVAEDVVSETFLSAFRNLKAFRSESGTAYGWLLGIARHKLVDLRRRASRAQFRTLSATEEPTDYDPSYGTLLATEARTAVLQVLESLPDNERLVLELKYFDCLSVREIAERMARTEKAVEAMLYRARQSFRRRYACKGSQ